MLSTSFRPPVVPFPEAPDSSSPTVVPGTVEDVFVPIRDSLLHGHVKTAAQAFFERVKGHALQEGFVCVQTELALNQPAHASRSAWWELCLLDPAIGAELGIRLHVLLTHSSASETGLLFYIEAGSPRTQRSDESPFVFFNRVLVSLELGLQTREKALAELPAQLAQAVDGITAEALLSKVSGPFLP